MGFDEEHTDAHDQCRHEIEELESQLAERNKQIERLLNAARFAGGTAHAHWPERAELYLAVLARSTEQFAAQNLSFVKLKEQLAKTQMALDAAYSRGQDGMLSTARQDDSYECCHTWQERELDALIERLRGEGE